MNPPPPDRPEQREQDEGRPSPEQIMQQLRAILASRHFRQARSLEKFLQYVIIRTLAGEADQLKEFTLGVEVFQRRRSFDPRIDTVVRVQAAHLRKKLADYYLEEGAHDDVLIDLPKGHYFPTFRLRPAQEAALPVSDDAVAAPPAPEASPQRREPRGNWVRVAAGVLLGFAAALAYGQWREPVQPPKPMKTIEPALLPIWEKFFAPDANTMLAYGTPQFFQFNGLYLRDVLVNSPREAEQESGARLETVRKTFRTKLDPIEIYTGVGEAHGINTMSRFFWEHSLDLKVARSRLVGWGDLKNTNLIFLSSLRFHTLMDELNYPNDFVIRKGTVASTLVNLHPAEGEQPSYGGAGEHYAIITLWPGKSDSRRVLQLSGNTTWGTLAAAEYVTDLESLRLLHGHLEQCRKQHGAAAHSPYFQVLVRAEVKDNLPISLTYVTHHDLTIAVPGAEMALREK
ncbi:MAG: hypothetical protein SF339_13880 [Blastocatellia bacterium]|nr:hypothetical protein [Blastocatellia bacterium]